MFFSAILQTVGWLYNVYVLETVLTCAKGIYSLDVRYNPVLHAE